MNADVKSTIELCNSRGNRIDELEKQRDELLEALKLFASLDWTREQPKGALIAFAAQARAAIAKAPGQS